MRIVVFRTGHLGDTVCAIPAFRQVREYYLNAHITLLCDASSGSKVASREIAKRLRIFDNIVTYRSGRGWRTTLDLFKCIRKIKPDVVVVLPQVNRSQRELAWHALFFKLSGVKKLYGFRIPSHVNEWVPNEPKRLLRLLDAEGIKVGTSRYNIPVDETASSSLHVKLQKRGVSFQEPYLIFCGGGKALTQKWPIDRYAEVLQNIYNEFELPIIGIGSASDLDVYSKDIKSVFSNLIIPGEPLDIGELIEVTRLATCYIGNDTGPMHLAAALNIPVIALISARNNPGQWDPDVTQRLIFRSRTECEGCWAEKCPLGHHTCMMSIDIDCVSDKASEFIKEIVSQG